MMTTIYDFDVKTETGESYSLDKYRGDVLLIVNTATKCGLAPQFEGLEKLYEAYRDRGLTVLGFPSDQFMQEVKDGEEAAAICRTTYGVSFPMHSVEKVNGKDAMPLFKYLTSEAPGKLNKSIKWNFTKFLIDRDGRIVKRYAPATAPEKIVKDIEPLLAECEA